jgi:hypothetical protein
MGCKILQVFFFLELVQWSVVGSIKILAKEKRKGSSIE